MKVAVGLRRVAAGKRTSGRRAAQIAIFKKFIFDNIKSCFLHLLVLIMEKVPRLAAKDYTFNPTTYIPHIGQR